MATKKAETQSNENIENYEAIKKEDDVVADKVVKKTKPKTTTGTTKKTSTDKKSTSKKNTEKTSTSKKGTTATKRKTSTNKKSEEKEQEGTAKENKIDKEIQKVEVYVEENKKEEIIVEPKSKEKTKRTTKTTKKKENVKENEEETQKVEEKEEKKKSVRKQPNVTKKEKNDEKNQNEIKEKNAENNKNEIKEKVAIKKKTTKNNSKRVNTRESKLKDFAQKVNQFAIDEEIEIEEEREKEEIIPQPKLIKIEEIKKTIKNKKELPQEEIKKINKMIFKNIMIAIGIIVYFIFLNLGKMNIENSVYTTDLKVFSMCTLLSAIIIIEIAYKKDSGEIALYGIELIMLAISTFALIYINLMLSSRYVFISTAISFIFAIYYLIKSIVIYLKKKKQYFVDDIKEIMNKEEVE